MSRDKYGEDHTITVDEGIGTLTIDGNLALTGAFDVDSIELASAVRQTIRLPGIAFRPENSSDFSNMTYDSATGRATFGGTTAHIVAPINIPHGAEWESIRAVGNAVGEFDSITITLRYSDGATSGSLIPGGFSWSDEGATEQDDSVPAADPSELPMDYTQDKAYFIRVVGQAATTSAYIAYIDLVYTIQRFPQNSSSTPV